MKTTPPTSPYPYWTPESCILRYIQAARCVATMAHLREAFPRHPLTELVRATERLVQDGRAKVVEGGWVVNREVQ